MAATGIIDLFTEFIHLRQTGLGPDEAWANIEVSVNALSRQQVDRLVAMLRGWEAKEGQQYRPAARTPSENPEATQPTPPRNVIRRIQPKDDEQPITEPINDQSKIACPSCQKQNPAGEIYCYSCGTLLMQPGGTQQIGGQDLDENGISRDVVFEDNMFLYLRIMGSQKAIRVRPRKDEMIIGRSSTDSVMLPDIDLAPFQADIQGVSRLHAGLRRQGETLVLTDLGSLNHTYINGQRLHPHEVRVIYNGDELRFGQLALRVYFRTDE